MQRSIIRACMAMVSLAGPFGLLCAPVVAAATYPQATPRTATFGKPTLYRIGSTGTAFDIVSGDFTGSHVKDIAIATGAGGFVALLAGRGDGTFAPAVTVYTEPGKSITAIAAGDFNGDGHLDLAIVSEGGTSQDIVLLLGDGHRHFARSARAPLRYLYQTGPLKFGGLRSIAVGAFTHRGTLDAAVTEGVNYLSVFYGDGHGGLLSRRDLLVTALPVSVLVSNLFGRGFADIGIVDSDSSSVYTFANRGDGTFATRQLTPLGALPVNARPVSLAGGDFRHLGRTDLFAVYDDTSGNNTIGKILLSDGHGSYAKAVDVPISGNVDFPESGAVADFNGDGISDLAAVSVVARTIRRNDVIVLPGNGDGTFSTAAQTRVPIIFPDRLAVPIADKLIVDDFNGDGKPDIAVAIDRVDRMGVAVLLNTTKATPSAHVRISWRSTAPKQPGTTLFRRPPHQNQKARLIEILARPWAPNVLSSG